MTDHKRFFCQDCILREMGRAMTMSEWIQHVSSHPTHTMAIDENDEEESDYQEILKS